MYPGNRDHSNSTPAATFGFDPAGNLLSLTAGNTTTTFTANNLNQRTSPGVNVYDAKGQTTDKDGRIFEWDDDGRMTAIVNGTHRSEFGYDGAGRRIKIAEFDNGIITSKKLYWWLGGEIVTQRDGIAAGFPIQKQYFGQGVIANGIKLFYTFDQLGSVRELIDSTGAVRADYRYSTYGERTKESGDLDSDWGYAGLWHHGPSGLDLATYRTYDSTMGRWISRDPLGEGVDYNLYRYCGNNPISGVDPSGLKPIRFDIKGFGKEKFKKRVSDMECAAGAKFDITYYENAAIITGMTGGEGTVLGRTMGTMLGTTGTGNFDFAAEFNSGTFIGALNTSPSGHGFSQSIDFGDFDTMAANGVPAAILNGLYTHEFSEALAAQTLPSSVGRTDAYNATHVPNGIGAENEAIGPTWHRAPEAVGLPAYTGPGGTFQINLNLQWVPHN